MGKKTIVVAYSLNRTIGKDNKLLWKQSADLKRFKEITTGGTVVMGRKTFESIGNPLPNRRNIIISRKLESGDVEVMSIDQVKLLEDNIFIIGGGEIYREFLDDCDEILATLIHTRIEGDTTFPEIDGRWMLVEATYHKVDEKNEFGYSFLKYINRLKNK
jgi:dihydrofolate reductase